MALVSSPRRRRRLFWLVVLAAVAAAIVAAVVVLPHHGGSSARTFGAPHNPLGMTTTPNPNPNAGKEQAAANAAAKAVRPLAEAFMADIVHRTQLGEAHALLAPKLASKYLLSDWEAGRHLPVTAASGSSVSTVLSFSGAKTNGFVSAVDTPGQQQSTLVAVRFDKQRGSWRIAYIGEGHSSRLVDQSNFAPSGFLPGSYNQSTKDWLILLLGVLAVIAVVVVLDRLLGGGGRPREA